MEETLGKRISAHRKRLGLTQDALAEKLGVTAQAVSKWENDLSCPDITMLPKLADIFTITTDELLGVPRKEIPLPEAGSDDPPGGTLTAESEPPAPGKRSVLASPGVAFGFWLFLTGLVALIDAVRLPPYDLADISLIHIALCCGIFTFGLSGLLRRFSVLRLGCAMAGFVFIFNLIAEPGIGDMDWHVPLLAGLALFGLDLLVDNIRNPQGSWKIMPPGHQPAEAVKNHCEYDAEHFRCGTTFGQGDRIIQLPRLSGGRGEVIFGELTIDLSGCPEIAENCRIDLQCTFGVLKLLVPRRYRVETAVSDAFGTVKEKGVTDPGAELTVYVNCTVSFGEIEIRHI